MLERARHEAEAHRRPGQGRHRRPDRAPRPHGRGQDRRRRAPRASTRSAPAPRQRRGRAPPPTLIAKDDAGADKALVDRKVDRPQQPLTTRCPAVGRCIPSEQFCRHCRAVARPSRAPLEPSSEHRVEPHQRRSAAAPRAGGGLERAGSASSQAPAARAAGHHAPVRIGRARVAKILPPTRKSGWPYALSPRRRGRRGRCGGNRRPGHGPGLSRWRSCAPNA